MGHPENIFLSKPDSSFICAICLEVLKDASSYKECGHTFCNECILRCSANPICPTCRKHVHTGSNPNYALRDIIDKLKVECMESDRPPLRRLMSDGRSRGKTIVYDVPGCDWRGTIAGLQHHIANECPYSTIMCGEEGCAYICQRREMNAHKSSEQVIIMHRVLKERVKKVQHDNKRQRQKIFDRIKDKQMGICFNETCRLPIRITCSRCQYADYCSPSCLNADFPNHAELCAKLVSDVQLTYGLVVYTVPQRWRGSGTYFVL